MYPNLMSATGAKFGVDQTKSLKALQARHDGVGNLPFSLHLDSTLASLSCPFGKWEPDMLACIDPITLYQG